LINQLCNEQERERDSAIVAQTFIRTVEPGIWNMMAMISITVI